MKWLQKIKGKHILEGIAAAAGIVALLAFVTGRAKLSEIFGMKEPDVWYAASLANKTDYPVSFSVYHPEHNIWAIVSIQAHSTKSFAIKNHTVDVTVNGDMIFEHVPRERLTHTYSGDEAYVLEASTFNHEPSDAEKSSAPINQFKEMFGGHRVLMSKQVIYFGLISPTEGGLKTYVVEAPTGKVLSVFEDGDTLIWYQPSPSPTVSPQR